LIGSTNASYEIASFHQPSAPVVAPLAALFVAQPAGSVAVAQDFQNARSLCMFLHFFFFEFSPVIS
jgi:hypothetical protein